MKLSPFSALLLFLVPMLYGCEAISQSPEQSEKKVLNTDSIQQAKKGEDSLKIAFMEEYGFDVPEVLPLNWEPGIDPANYPLLKQKHRDSLNLIRGQYQKATSDSTRKSLQNAAGDLLEYTLTEQFFPCWYGTTWDFNGYTSKPNDGLIACGYFVSTPLLHAGFEVNRYKLAQQAAMQIIESLHGEPQVFSGITSKEFTAEVAKMEEGLYVVGLENHVGWIHHRDGEVYFIHSSYGTPSVVVREIAAESEVLSWSHLFALGEVTTNEELMDLWLKGDTVEIHYTR